MKIAVFFVSLASCCSAMAATPIDGWYSSVFGGYTYIPGNVNKTAAGLTRNHVTYESGFDGGGNIGFKSNPLRYEGEIFYLKANTNQFDVNRVKQTGVSGYNQGIFALTDVYYDLPGMFSSLLQPYLGVGIGYGWIQTRLDSTGPNSTTRFTASNSAFAYQGQVGVTYNFAENYALSLGYRYLSTTNISRFGNRFQAQIANLGASYRFDGNNYK